jgi:hypothetical protein
MLNARSGAADTLRIKKLRPRLSERMSIVLLAPNVSDATSEPNMLGVLLKHVGV